MFCISTLANGNPDFPRFIGLEFVWVVGMQPSTIQSNLSRGIKVFMLIMLWILHGCIEIFGNFYGFCMDITIKFSMF